MIALAEAGRYSRSVSVERSLSNGLSVTELGLRVKRRRHMCGMGIEALASRSGVSRSMISDIERGLKMPTVLVLDHIATAMGTSIAHLLDEPSVGRVVALPRSAQRVVEDPSGWQRRILSPVLPGVDFEFMCTTIGPGVDAGEFSPHGAGSREYLVVERGRLTLTIDDEPRVLMAGDAIFYHGDCRHAFANTGRRDCVYYLAVDLGPGVIRPAH